jgi:hypothetical protein
LKTCCRAGLALDSTEFPESGQILRSVPGATPSGPNEATVRTRAFTSSKRKAAFLGFPLVSSQSGIGQCRTWYRRLRRGGMRRPLKVRFRTGAHISKFPAPHFESSIRRGAAPRRSPCASRQAGPAPPGDTLTLRPGARNILGTRPRRRPRCQAGAREGAGAGRQADDITRPSSVRSRSSRGGA